MKIALILLFVCICFGCAHKITTPQPKIVNMRFESDMPVVVTVETNECEGNYNFCHLDNYNFKKWE